ncbi:MAG: type II toxin-antitoxin system VapB family antitoxin [Acidimicrobiales bacterium]
MAKEKATITVDRAKLSEARALLRVSSASAAIDVALSELVRRYRVLHDVEAYTRTPLTDEETALSQTALSHFLPDWNDLADDTDWDAEWPEDS